MNINQYRHENKIELSEYENTGWLNGESIEIINIWC